MTGRSEETQRAYEDRVRCLLGAASRAAGRSSGQVGVQELVQYLLDYREEWSPSTWRQYKAAVLSVFRGTGSEEDENALDQLHQTAQPTKLETRCTSAQRQKSLPPADMASLVGRLRRRRSRYAAPLMTYFVAAGVTGLRPGEWPGAAWDETSQTLIVRNAKHDDQRAHGPTRTIDLSDQSTEILAMVEAWLGWVAGECRQGTYASSMEAMQKLLYRVSRALWPARETYPMLYSTRHQSVANWKRASLSQEVMAALLGHASDRTASEHYGRRAAGAKGLRPGDTNLAPPRASSEEIQRVRTRARPAPRPASPEP